MRVEIEEVPNVCNYCRKIMKDGNFPEFLEIYRGDMLCLTVDVVAASRLRLVEEDKKGLYYKQYRQKDYDKLKTYPRTVSLDTPDAFK